VTQVLEYLSSKGKALNSNSSTDKKKYWSTSEARVLGRRQEEIQTRAEWNGSEHFNEMENAKKLVKE
jgi:hypothetical protein